MRWYERFAQKYRNFGISNLSAYISISMLIVFFAQSLFNLPIIDAFSLDMAQVMNGQVWRLITFMFIPTTGSFFWIIFVCYTYYMIGSQLEAHWGKAVFTLYYMVGAIGTILGALLTGGGSNGYLNISMFLAFAFLYPNAMFRLYFFIPIKAKYLAFVQLGFYAISLGRGIYYGFKFGRWSLAAMLIASIINFIIFFLPDIIINIQRRLKNRKRKKEYERDLRGGGQ